MYEIIYFNNKISSNHFVSSTTVFEVNNSEIENITFDDYQALYPLPYFWVGSEFTNKAPRNYLFKESLKISSETGLSIIGNSLSRTSFSHSMNILKLVYQVNIDQQIFDGYIDKEILLIKEKNDKLLAVYDSLLLKAKYLMTENALDFYSVSFKDFKERKLKAVDLSSFGQEREIGFHEISIVEVPVDFDVLLIKLPLPSTVKEWPEIRISNEYLDNHKFNVEDYLFRIDAAYMYVQIPYSEIKSKKFKLLFESEMKKHKATLYFK